MFCWYWLIAGCNGSIAILFILPNLAMHFSFAMSKVKMANACSSLRTEHGNSAYRLNVVLRYMLTSINHLWKEGSAECFKKQNDEQKLVKAFGKGDYFRHQSKDYCFILFPHISPPWSCIFMSLPAWHWVTMLSELWIAEYATSISKACQVIYIILSHTLHRSAFVVCRGLRSWRHLRRAGFALQLPAGGL